MTDTYWQEAYHVVSAELSEAKAEIERLLAEISARDERIRYLADKFERSERLRAETEQKR